MASAVSPRQPLDRSTGRPLKHSQISDVSDARPLGERRAAPADQPDQRQAVRPATSTTGIPSAGHYRVPYRALRAVHYIARSRVDGAVQVRRFDWIAASACCCCVDASYSTRKYYAAV